MKRAIVLGLVVGVGALSMTVSAAFQAPAQERVVTVDKVKDNLYVLKGGGTVDEFNRRLSMLYFDTCLHARKSLELLLGIAGSQHVMFGTENPGSGSAPNPETGKPFDDIKPLIDAIPTLTDEDRRNIFEDNARRLFSRLQIPRAQETAAR